MAYQINHTLTPTQRVYSEQFKFMVASAALSQAKTIDELCEEHDIVPSQVYEWKNILTKRGPELFVDKRRKENKARDETKQYLATIEQQKEEIRFLEHVLKSSSQKHD
jgi:transposase-like protein